MKFVITGADGFIGTNLVDFLAKEGQDVVALTRTNKTTFLPRVKRIVTDYQDINALASSLDDYKGACIIHLAWEGVNGAKKADEQVQLANVALACKVCEFGAKLSASRLIFAGTVAENAVKSFDTAQTLSKGMLYAAAKNAAKNFVTVLAKSMGLNFVWLTLGNIYGENNQTGNLLSFVIEKLKAGEPAELGPCDQWYDFVYIDDVLRGVALVAKAKTLTKTEYYVGSGKPKKLKTFMQQVGKKMGKPELIKIGARASDGIKYSKKMFDISALKSEIGEYALVDFASGLDKII